MKKGGKLKWIIIAIVVIAIIGAVAGGGDSDDKPSNSSPTKTGEVEKESSDSSDQRDEKEGQNSEFKVGDVVETSNLKISFLSSGEYESENEFISPKDGHVFYKMDFEFENISDSDENVSSFDFKCYADGYDMEQSYMEGLDLDATLSPGKKTKGSVLFEVPVDCKEIMLEYETNFWTESKIVFIVK